MVPLPSLTGRGSDGEGKKPLHLGRLGSQAGGMCSPGWREEEELAKGDLPSNTVGPGLVEEGMVWRDAGMWHPIWRLSAGLKHLWPWSFALVVPCGGQRGRWWTATEWPATVTNEGQLDGLRWHVGVSCWAQISSHGWPSILGLLGGHRSCLNLERRGFWDMKATTWLAYRDIMTFGEETPCWEHMDEKVGTRDVGRGWRAGCRGRRGRSGGWKMWVSSEGQKGQDALGWRVG